MGPARERFAFIGRRGFLLRLDESAGSACHSGMAMTAPLEVIESRSTTRDRLDRYLAVTEPGGAVDALVAAIDGLVARQLDAILHHPSFQRLEAAWRGLWFVVSRTDFRENIVVLFVSCSKGDLGADFARHPELMSGGLYRLVYEEVFLAAGGQPYGAVIAGYDFGPGDEDVALLRRCAFVAACAHAPFLAAAAPRFFGVDRFGDLDPTGDLRARFEAPELAAFAAFRETDDARWIGLTLPRFLLREAHVAPFRETVTGDDDRLWGGAALAFATRLADSFARYRWCPNIVGPQGGGQVDDCTPEARIDLLGDEALSARGFVPLAASAAAAACFLSAFSVQRPRSFEDTEEGRAMQLNHWIGAQLPYLFVTSRITQLMKLAFRDLELGRLPPREAEREINDWIGQHVADRMVLPPGVRRRQVLRKARILVSEVTPEWSKFDLLMRPLFKHQGAFFTLSVVGKLDQIAP